MYRVTSKYGHFFFTTEEEVLVVMDYLEELGDDTRSYKWISPWTTEEAIHIITRVEKRNKETLERETRELQALRDLLASK